ncbi:TIR domain-containing protein [Terasakiella sp.]|uniref:TIR domain-containing protein n=1 Tax=Terasakiella sp. TaxID=2034861 RepID=UPI003AA8179F
MSTHIIHVFISHAWSRSEHYDTIADWVFEQNWSIGQASIVFKNFSVPKNDPIHDAESDKELEEAIFRKISRSHVIVIPTGMYASYRKWIQKEIDGSKSYKKPILAVNPWGQKRKSSIVLDNADDEAGWNAKSVVTKIWNLYYNS